MNQSHIQFQEPPAITPLRRGSAGDPWWRYRSLLEDAIRDKFMVKSLFVQIGVLYWTWLITANATGERQTNASLTLAMPHGRLLRASRYQWDLSKSRSRLEEEKHSLFLLPPNMELVHRYHKTWEVKKIRRDRWWSFLTRG